MTKERFVERYGVPLYTVGVGGSGGAIQQYVYGQNHPGLLDAAIPQYSYPDMVTQTIHVGDCELLEHYMDVTDARQPEVANWDDREWLIGLNARRHAFPNPYTATARQRRVRERLARADAAGAEPAVRHRRRGHGTENPAVMADRQMDPLGGRPQRLRRRADGYARSPGTTSASSTASRRSSTATSRPPSSST